MDQNQQVSTAIVACLAGGCRCPARTAGYCPTHYQQVRRHGRLTPGVSVNGRTGCRIPGCEEVHSPVDSASDTIMSEYYLPRKQGTTAEVNRAAA